MLMQPPVSPVMQAMAAAVVAADDRPMSSVSMIAPLSHGHAQLLVSWAGMEPDRQERPVSDGITVLAWSRHPDHVIALPPLTAPEAAIIEAAWAWGAWDIVRHCYGPGYAGAMPGEWNGFAADLRTQGWAIWTFRPMMGGPEIRAKAHAKSDPTLHPVTLGRHGALPDVRPPPLRPETRHVIKLGRDKAPTAGAGAGKRVPSATARQIGLIRHLRREAGITDGSDARRMTIRDASAEIERLLKLMDERGPRPSADGSTR